MKKIFLTGLFSLLIFSQANCQSWDWAKGLGYNEKNYYHGDLKRTPSGNLLITYLSNPFEEVYSDIVYCSAEGAVLWKKHFPNLGIQDCHVDANEKLYFAGYYKETVDLGEFKLTSRGGLDALLAVFDASGTLVQEKDFGTDQDEQANSLYVFGGNIYASGVFSKSFNLDAVSLVSDNGNETWIVKFNPALTAEKGFYTLSEGSASGIEIHVSTGGWVYLLGEGQGTIAFGGKKISIEDHGQYFAKFSTDLAVHWAEVLITNFSNGRFEEFIESDKTNNAYLLHVTGGGGGQTHDILVTKINTEGTVAWRTPALVNSPAYMDMDTQGDLLVAGQDRDFDGSTRFSLTRVSPAGASSQIVYNSNMTHNISGFVLKSDNSFYIAGGCEPASAEPAGFACTDGNQRFLALASLSGTTSISAAGQASAFKIFPNPSAGLFTLSAVAEGGTISVYDVTGQCILKQSLRLSQLIDLSGKTKGIYFIEINSGNEKINKKILVN
jgi:hypothetical protein